MYEYRAVVRRHHDGDSVFLDIDQGFKEWKHDWEIRMIGIDAPELKDKPAGPEAAAFLAGIIPVGSIVLLRSKKDHADKYGGRWLGTIYSNPVWDDEGRVLNPGQNLNRLMLDSGHAVVYP